jgi:hypothetical protein
MHLTNVAIQKTCSNYDKAQVFVSFLFYFLFKKTTLANDDNEQVFMVPFFPFSKMTASN